MEKFFIASKYGTVFPLLFILAYFVLQYVMLQQGEKSATFTAANTCPTGGPARIANISFIRTPADGRNAADFEEAATER